MMYYKPTLPHFGAKFFQSRCIISTSPFFQADIHCNYYINVMSTAVLHFCKDFTQLFSSSPLLLSSFKVFGWEDGSCFVHLIRWHCMAKSIPKLLPNPCMQ